MATEQLETDTRDNYRWVVLTNATAAVFMSALDGSIVIISLPAIFRGIHLDPLAPANISYLLWMTMGYRLVQSVLVVTLGRLGDMYGRVRAAAAPPKGSNDNRIDATVKTPAAAVR
jgi:MFS family permease